MVFTTLDLMASFLVQRKFNNYCLLRVPSITFLPTYPFLQHFCPFCFIYCTLLPYVMNSVTEYESSGFRTAIFWILTCILVVSTFNPRRWLRNSSCINCHLHQIRPLFLRGVGRRGVVIYSLIDEEENESSSAATSVGRLSDGLVHYCPSQLHSASLPPERNFSKCFQRSYFILPKQAGGSQSKQLMSQDINNLPVITPLTAEGAWADPLLPDEWSSCYF